MEQLKEIADANTVVGDPITTPDGTVLIPISKVRLGFGLGGSNFPSDKSEELFGGGSGAGVSVTPMAFLSISNGNIKVMPISSDDTTADKIVSLIPELFDKVNTFVNNRDAKKETDI